MIQLIKPKGKTAQFLTDIRDNKNISVFGMPFYSRGIVLGDLESFLYVCPDYVKAGEAYEQLKSIRNDVVYIPPVDDVLSAYKHSSSTTLTRLTSLMQIALGEARVAVTSMLGFMQLYPQLADIKNATIDLRIDKAYDIDGIIKGLIRAGYTRVEHIEDSGQFALRGDILDVAPVNMPCGVRIDFFDDTVERIREIDLDNQSAGNELSDIQIAPSTEIFIDNQPDSTNKVDKIIGFLQKSINKKLEPQYTARQAALVEELTLKLESGSGGGLDYIKPLVSFAHLADYFDMVVFDEQKQCVDNANSHLSEHNSRLTALLARGEAFPFMENHLTPLAEIIQKTQSNQIAQTSQFSQIIPKNQSNQIVPKTQYNPNGANQKTLIAFDKLLCQNRIFAPESVYNFDSPDLGSYAKNQQLLVDDIKMWLGRKMNVQVFCEGKLKDGVKQLFEENRIPTDIVKKGPLYKGGCFFEENQILLGRGDLTFKRQSAPTKNKKAAFFQPKPGDYVVHNVHGIGVCEGLKRMESAGSARDFIVVRYEGGDRLYVAAESINLLSAYAGEEGPKLNKIGGAEFARIKEKVKSAIKAMAFDLGDLYAKRESARGHKYNPDNYALSEFEMDFPYEETPDQLTAISEGLADLTGGKIMDRLLCGDVGYGKTEVAMRLAYKVVLEGKQVAVVSPTTILARQHYATMQKRMEKFGVVVKPVTRFEPQKNIDKTLLELSEGRVDILCGTHRALSKDVVFKDLGLMVLDEEQRFGVADKEKIKLFKTDVNVLSLSATPIPRTLHMAMSGIRDISLLTTPPPSRIPVSTYVAEYTDSLVFDAVNRETGRGGQVFIVYNRVEKIDSFASGIANMFPALKVATAHGQMEKARLELTINDFADKKTDILITSTIIENGIDLPNVNTMIVVDADHLGLSQLYQLRGRIGRGDRLAYAFFTYDGRKTLTESAYKRLEAIAGYTELGSGFKLAMRDLEIRGAGNILGREQHGHMQKVGYEMYLKLIGEVMDEMQGKQTAEKAEVNVVTDFAAFIPEDYVRDIDWRLKIYKRVADIDTEDEATSELMRLKDTYGRPPQPLKNLLTVAVVKNNAAKIGALKVTVTRKTCEIRFDKAKIDLKIIKEAVESGFIYSAADASISLRPDASTLKRLVKFLLSAANL